MRRTALAVASLLPAALVLVPGSAQASEGRLTADRCPKYSQWETHGGSQWHARIEFRASDTCNGRRVKAAYIRIKRDCWPAYDSGRIYARADSYYESTLRVAQTWAWDSPRWSCNTPIFHGWEYWSGPTY